MKNIKKIVVLLTVIVVSSLTVNAQDLIGISYSMTVPTTGINNYISKTSFQGGNVEYRHFLNDNLSVGGYFGLHYFEEALGEQTYSNEAGAISGQEFRDVNVLNTMATAHYYLGQLGGIRPYAGVGIGAAGNYINDQIGGISISDQYWGFAIAPEVGVIVPMGNSGLSFLSNVKYNYTAAAKGYDAYGYWDFNIGIAFDF